MGAGKNPSRGRRTGGSRTGAYSVMSENMFAGSCDSSSIQAF